MTGSMPTFVDAGRNFGGSKVMEDNLLKQWSRAGKRILFVGDKTWIELFPDCDIISKLQPTDILFIMGDHGMTLSGDHGGDSYSELEATLIVYTSEYHISLSGKDSLKRSTGQQQLSQIDLVPTLSFFTGVPIPYSNLGILSSDLLNGYINLHNGLVLNFIQMFTYTANYYYNISELPLSSKLFMYMNKLLLENRNFRWIEEMNYEQLLTSLKELQSIFRNHWTQFNEISMLFGVILITYSLILLLLCIEYIHQCRHSLYTCNLSLCGASILSLICIHLHNSYCLVYIFIIVLVLLPIFFIFIQYIYNLISLFTLNSGTSIGFMLIFLLSLSYFSNSLLIHEFHITFYFIQSFLITHLIYTFVYTYSFHGNDYTTHDRSSSIVKYIRKIISFLHHLSTSSSIVFISLLLIVFRLFIWHLLICREELMLTSSICRSTLDPWISKSLSRLNPMNEFYPIGVLRVYFTICILIFCLYNIYWLELKIRDRSELMDICRLNNPFWLFTLIGGCLALLWLVDSAKSVNWIGFIPTNRLHTVRIWIARILLITISCTFIQLMKSPFKLIHLTAYTQFNESIQRQIRRNKSILHLYTVLAVTCLTVLPLLSLLVFINEFHIIWLALITSVHLLLSPLKHSITDITTEYKDQNSEDSMLLFYVPKETISWKFAVFLCLLDNLSFFLTGHQTTLSSIPWDAAYAVYEGDHNTHWLPTITVLLHLYSGPIIIAFSLPVIIIIGLQVKRTQRSETYSNVNGCQMTVYYRFIDALSLLMWRFFICKCLLTLGCLLSTGILRRHLMVWKIFAPRLTFSIISLLVSSICLPVTRFMVVHCLHKKMCQILHVSDL
ncbi:unnamed protein product [Heterobilharzia americana]|nr:unnamed protein product [Heterobilharzia americana]